MVIEIDIIIDTIDRCLSREREWNGGNIRVRL